MISLPSLCDHCGKCFIGEFGGTLDGRISLKGQSAPGCPACGGNISVPNGKYSFAGNVIRLMTRPAVTLTDLQNFDALLDRVEDGSLSIRKCVAEISAHHPRLFFFDDLFLHYATSPEVSLQALAGFFRAMIAAVQVYWPGKDTDFARFEHSVNEHFFLSLEQMETGKKDALEELILAVPPMVKNIGKARMQKLKRARKGLKRKR